MEAALAIGLLEVVGNKLFSLISSEFIAIMGVKQDLSMLQHIQGEVTSWLSAVRDRAMEADPSLGWVIKLRNLANDIYDLLDELCLEDEKLKIGNNLDKHATSDVAQPWLHSFRDKITHKVEEIKVTFDVIAKQRRDANAAMLNLDVVQLVQSNNKATRQQSLLLSNVEESKIPSRDRVKSEIISKLVESNEGEGHIVSIVGLCGSGKTNLAQQICHDDKIKEHFKDKIFWVHISQEFCRDKLIGKVFQAITGQKSDGLKNQQIICAISNKLCGKESLLVFDDAWHEDSHDWEKFMVFLNGDASRTKILLTTRNQNVANAVESRLVFKLAFLSEDESWNFFLKSSGLVEDDLESDFIQIGKDIVKQCGGVPLAIKILGSILCERRGINSWRAIRDGNLWDDETMEHQVFASLKWSYIYLKDHLKQCFTFCSIFPKGYKINRDYLIEQWMAHGFLKLENEELAEDIGNEYFDALMKLGFLQNPVERWPEKSVVCKMPELIHDLTRYILHNEVVTFLPMNMTPDCTKKCRYLSLTTCYENVERGRFDKVRALCVSGCNPSFDNFVNKSCHIRSIVLDYAIDTLFPLFTLKLEHLGYLEIHHVSCTELPEAISDCWNLQSLHFIICKGFVTLPNSIGKLSKLRTLELNCVSDLESLPESIGNCRNLQYLKVNYCEKFKEIPCSVGSIEKLRVLIVRCSPFHLRSEFNGEFRNLRTINLSGCQGVQGLPSTFACPMLHTLDLSETKVKLLPLWITSIGTLECINLRNCKELVELPKGIANLRNLAVFNLAGCSKLQCMPSGFGQLTRLRDLSLFAVGCGRDDARISELENLNMICNGHLAITNLTNLKDPSEAQKAMLKLKNIRSLVLDWPSNQAKDELLSYMEQDQGVLNALEPPANIRYMEIRGYRGSYLSRWMMNGNDSCCYTELLSLTKLTLEGFPNLKYVRGLLEFPSLKSLYLLKMTNLEELWTTTNGIETHGEEFGAKYCFPVLSELSITSCPKLNVKPYFPPSLVTLSFQESNEQLLCPGSSSIHSAVSHLRVLNLTEMTASSSSWEFLQFHTELVTLSIDSCGDLTQLPESIRSLTSLKHLRINRCSNLAMMPDWLGELRLLRSLSVYTTPMIDSLPQSTEHLKFLTMLQISGWRNMKELPDVIQHLISLELLNLGSCSRLTVLPEWIGQLSALRRIWIQHCSALECLPQSIQRLTALRELKISWCRGLYRRYKRGLGPDWHLISHIPDVRIDGRLE
ncbi:hypothetical protein HU200_029279 [Digitaria exilis]|uniref:Uncharacterized protein n=1 Tax=Digitaria exilis TaxID=1010633 RepID=A0A835BTL9_9POAL|nr:hypothetical protein HU200_029279 [Digitaria exilis]